MSFPVNALKLKNPAILVRPSQAECTAGKNVIIRDPRKDYTIEKTSCHEIVLETSVDGKENIKITIKFFCAQRQSKSPIREEKRCHCWCPGH
jgi:hypothetical protein